MCPSCKDLQLTLSMLDDLARYCDRRGADWEFADTVGYALTASLPVIVDGPPDDSPGQEW